jgi:HPt (histidine-containing phosphotransfer) domain-containing protein
MFTENFTPKTAEIVSVEKMLADLVPGFIKNKIDDLHFIDDMIKQKDYGKIKKIGHNWKGACPSYGFHYLGEVGKQFEILVQNQDYENLEKLVSTLPTYLKNVSIEYSTEY